jgi:hypothetical protein
MRKKLTYKNIEKLINEKLGDQPFVNAIQTEHFQFFGRFQNTRTFAFLAGNTHQVNVSVEPFLESLLGSEEFCKMFDQARALSKRIAKTEKSWLECNLDGNLGIKEKPLLKN